MGSRRVRDELVTKPTSVHSAPSWQKETLRLSSREVSFFFQLKTRSAPSPGVTGSAGILTEGSCILRPPVWILCASSSCEGSTISCALRIRLKRALVSLDGCAVYPLPYLTVYPNPPELLNVNFQGGNWITADSSYQVIHVQNPSHFYQ